MSTEKVPNNKLYINIESFLSPKYPVTFVIGARGVGKTIGALKTYIAKCYKAGTYFIYLRRFQTEIDDLALPISLLSDLTGFEITVANDKQLKRVTVYADGKPVGYLQALSTAGKIKSNDYTNVEQIIYDEFIDPRERELKGETGLFLNFAATVFRDFSKYRALFLANATNLYNNYFLDFEIMPNGRITRFSKLGIKIVMYETAKELDALRLHTPLSIQMQLLNGIGDEALFNKFTGDFDDFIRVLGPKAKQRAVWHYAGKTYGVWYDRHGYLITEKCNLSTKVQYALTSEEIREGIPLIPDEDRDRFVRLYRAGALFYDTARTRSKIIKYLKTGMTMLY